MPEAYGGVGADALATAIVIEEVARACASTSLVPAVNKLGTTPWLLAGDEELLAHYLPRVASGEAMVSYCCYGADPRSTRARPRRRPADWSPAWTATTWVSISDGRRESSHPGSHLSVGCACLQPSALSRSQPAR
ncbi:MAG: acyl-CoA dehydrogenase family protein [Janthinobacterium lividum]